MIERRYDKKIHMETIDEHGNAVFSIDEESFPVHVLSANLVIVGRSGQPVSLKCRVKRMVYDFPITAKETTILLGELR